MKTVVELMIRFKLLKIRHDKLIASLNFLGLSFIHHL